MHQWIRIKSNLRPNFEFMVDSPSIFCSKLSNFLTGLICLNVVVVIAIIVRPSSLLASLTFILVLNFVLIVFFIRKPIKITVNRAVDILTIKRMFLPPENYRLSEISCSY